MQTDKRKWNILLISFGCSLVLILILLGILFIQKKEENVKEYDNKIHKKTSSTDPQNVHNMELNTQQKGHVIDDLKPITKATLSALSGLATGSREAQERQQKSMRKLNLPLEVATKKTGIHFRLIPAGTFWMGSPFSEVGRDEDEKLHRVSLTAPFYCGMYEVTQDQWRQVMGHNPSRFKRPSLDTPVENVSWPECDSFCRKLCEIEGVPEGTYRLPTEAEWEYACRAGTKTAYCYGDSLKAPLGQVKGKDLYGDGREEILRVGSFTPNAFGLHDMHDNIWEWCLDHYETYKKSSQTDPLNDGSDFSRVSRGGSWFGEFEYCRSADRYRYSQGFRNLMGLRLVRAIKPNPKINKMLYDMKNKPKPRFPIRSQFRLPPTKAPIQPNRN